MRELESHSITGRMLGKWLNKRDQSFNGMNILISVPWAQAFVEQSREFPAIGSAIPR
jgi:hypothetical protein